MYEYLVVGSQVKVDDLRPYYEHTYKHTYNEIVGTHGLLQRLNYGKDSCNKAILHVPNVRCKYEIAYKHTNIQIYITQILNTLHNSLYFHCVGGQADRLNSWPVFVVGLVGRESAAYLLYR